MCSSDASEFLMRNGRLRGPNRFALKSFEVPHAPLKKTVQGSALCWRHFNDLMAETRMCQDHRHLSAFRIRVCDCLCKHLREFGKIGRQP
jgi:hypothetical protein